MKYVFTITPGRTATLSLAKLFAINPPKTGVEAVTHEVLSFRETGYGFPGLLPPVHYNTYPGFTEELRDWWRRKYQSIERLVDTMGEDTREHVNTYIETSHLLSKSGLVNVVVDSFKEYPNGIWPLSPGIDEVHFILLHREPFEVVCSMFARGDYQDIASMWTWHLDPSYPYNLLSSETFGSPIFWYVWEMEARRTLYEQWVNGLNVGEDLPIYFHNFMSSQLSERDKSRELLEKIRGEEIDQYCKLPEKDNAGESSDHYKEQFQERRAIIDAPFVDGEGTKLTNQETLQEIVTEHLSNGEWTDHKGTTEHTDIVERRLRTQLKGSA